MIELSTKLKCHRQTIYNKIKSGELEKYAINTDDGIRFNESDLLAIKSIVQTKSTSNRQSNDKSNDSLKDR